MRTVEDWEKEERRKRKEEEKEGGGKRRVVGARGRRRGGGWREGEVLREGGVCNCDDLRTNKNTTRDPDKSSNK